jgi:hypothetical protein
MDNYEYIIASLPVLTPEYKYPEGENFDSFLESIRSQLSEKDAAVLDTLLEGFLALHLTPDFYQAALSHPCPFIREYFRFDLNFRNAKVEFLNRELGRPSGNDVMSGLGGPEDENLDIDLYRFRGGEFEEEAATQRALSHTSLLDREKALDQVVWDKVDSLSTFHAFDLTAVLAFVAKLHIADRWLALDEARGRELFKQLVTEVQSTFKGVNYTES